MYFGYSEIWRFTFVPLGCLIVMSGFVALCLVYAVGFSKGKRAAARYLAWTLRLLGVAVVLDLVWAITSGDLSRFVLAFGWTPLIELTILSLMCVGTLGFMGARYVASKPDDETGVAEVAAAEAVGGEGSGRA